ncbi:hypothetical protein SLE2022_285280 [Rubroshorea leprosula]
MATFIGAFSTELGGILSNKLKEEFLAFEGLEHDIEILKKNLDTIDRELQVADLKNNFHVSMSLWLMRLTDSLYDIEDVLDELEYRKTQLEKSTKWEKFLYSNLQFMKLKYCRPFAREIRKISNNLEFIAKEKGSGIMQGGQIESPWQISSHSIGCLVSNIYGRDDVLPLITETLLSNQSTAPLAIVGIAGVGKTALT